MAPTVTIHNPFTIYCTRRFPDLSAFRKRIELPVGPHDHPAYVGANSESILYGMPILRRGSIEPGRCIINLDVGYNLIVCR